MFLTNCYFCSMASDTSQLQVSLEAPLASTWGLDPLQPFSAPRLQFTAQMVFLQLLPEYAAKAMRSLNDMITATAPGKPASPLFLPMLKHLFSTSQADKLQLFSKIIQHLDRRSLEKLNAQVFYLRKDDLAHFKLVVDITMDNIKNHDAACCFMSHAVETLDTELVFNGLTPQLASMAMKGPTSDYLRQLNKVAEDKENHPKPSLLQYKVCPFEREDWHTALAAMGHALHDPADPVHVNPEVIFPYRYLTAISTRYNILHSDHIY